MNPYEVEGDAPTATAIVMADPPENSASPVGVMQSSEGPDFAEYGSGVPVYKFKFFDEDCYLRWSGNSTAANTCFRLAWASRLLLIQGRQRIRN